MIESYPLQWPGDYPRTAYPKRSRFKTTLAAARDFVKAEINRIGGTNSVISTNVPTKQNGDLYADWQRYGIKDFGVAVYFTRNNQQVVLCCDTYVHVWENMHAIGRTIKALRQIDRDGVSDFLNRTFTGFKSLPAAAPWYTVLQVAPNATEDEIKEAYRKLAMQHHPDKGGTADIFNQITNAYKMGIQNFK